MDKVYAAPKPKLRKQQKAKNNPMPTENDLCAVCGRAYAHNHEVFFGTGERQISIKYGLQERLCYEHHNKPYGMNPHYNKHIDTILKQKHQRIFEETHSREEWMKLIGKNYLEG